MQVIPFYSSLGHRPLGDVFDEDGGESARRYTRAHRHSSSPEDGTRYPPGPAVTSNSVLQISCIGFSGQVPIDKDGDPRLWIRTTLDAPLWLVYRQSVHMGQASIVRCCAHLVRAAFLAAASFAASALVRLHSRETAHLLPLPPSAWLPPLVARALPADGQGPTSPRPSCPGHAASGTALPQPSCPPPLCKRISAAS